MTSGVREPPYQTPRRVNYRKELADDNSTRKSLKSVEFASDEESLSVHSDNFSTTPLKLIMSRTSTSNTASVLSAENQQDNASLVASTAETSLYPSTHVSLSPSIHGQARNERDRDRDRERDRDSESIITLASSSRRTRRRSIDTNCSVAGIAPASIMERLSVHPMPHNNADAHEE